MTESKARRFSWLTALILVSSSVLVSLAIWRVASVGEQKRADARFNEYFSVRADLLAGQIYETAEELYHLRSSLKASNRISRNEFTELAGETLLDHPAISAVEWVPRVTIDKRSLHERRAESNGLRGYVIKALDGNGRIVVAPPKPEYFPVFYTQSGDPNRHMVGFDLSSQVDRQAALQMALKTGSVVLTDPLDLGQGRTTSKGILAVLPLMDEGKVGTADSAEHLAGFLVLVIQGEALLKQALLLGDWRISFQLVNDSSAGTPAVICASPDWDAKELYPEGAVVRLIEVGGQHWRLMGRPTRAFLATERTAMPFLLGGGVFLLWNVLGGALTALGLHSQNLARRKHERTLATVVESLSEGVVVADATGRMTAFNGAATRIIGLGITDDSPQHWSSEYGCYLPDGTTLYQPEQLPLVRAVGGEEIKDEEMLIRNLNTPEGVWISINGSPLVDERGFRVGGVVAFRDITERKRQEERLRLLSNAVEQTADMVFITDKDGKIEYVNPAFEATTGYSRGEAIGQSPRLLKSGEHDHAHYEELWTTILAGKVYRGTSVNKKKNGEIFYAEQTITPIKASQGQVVRFVSVIKDVTETIRRHEREVEMRYARQVQQNLYPDRQACVDGLEIAGGVFPASATCGDYFDHFQMPDGRVLIAVGDVCGHGLGPALIMAETRAYLRCMVRTHSSLGDILEATNEFLHADLETGSYVTLVLVAIDPRSRRLIYANAGHTSGHVLDRNGAVRAVLESGGFPLGMFPKSRYTCGECQGAEHGDLVVLSTDGMTESLAPDGSELGSEHLLDCVRAHIHRPVIEIVDNVYQAIQHTGSQSDDITLAICRIN